MVSDGRVLQDELEEEVVLVVADFEERFDDEVEDELVHFYDSLND